MTASLSGARFAGRSRPTSLVSLVPGWLVRRRVARMCEDAAEVRESTEWTAELRAAAPPDVEAEALALARRMHLDHVGNEWLAVTLEAVRHGKVPFTAPAAQLPTDGAA